MLLSELKTGESAVITKVKGYGAFRKRLNEDGVREGQSGESREECPFE